MTLALLVVMVLLAVTAIDSVVAEGRRTLLSMALGGLFLWSALNDYLLFLNGLVLVGFLFSLDYDQRELCIAGKIAIGLGFLGTLLMAVTLQVALGFLSLVMIMAFPVEGTHDLSVPLPWQVTVSIIAQVALIGFRVWLSWPRSAEDPFHARINQI